MKKYLTLIALLFFITTNNLSAQELRVLDNYGLNLRINVYYSGASGINGSWIALYKADAADGQYLSYQYINEKTEGELAFGPGYTEGYYNFRMYSGSGYKKIATSKTFLIRQGVIPDTAFGTGGIFKWDASDKKLLNTAKALKPAKYDKVLIAGEVKTGIKSPNGYETVAFTIFRLNADGSLDDTFGNHGKQIIQPYSSYFPLYLLSVKAMAIQPDNKIILGGGTQVYSTDGNNSHQILLVRLSENGTIDESFGDKGFALHQMGYPSEHPSNITDDLRCIEVDHDGSILIGGGSLTAAPYTPGRPFIGKIRPNGMIDTDFAGIGFVTPEDSIDFRGYVESILLSHTPEDKTFYAVASAVAQFGKNHQIVYKYKNTGYRDNSFGDNGLKTLRYAQIPHNTWTTNSMVWHPYGGITLIGQIASTGIWLSTISPATGGASMEFGESGYAYTFPYEGGANILSKGAVCGEHITVAYTSLQRRIGMTRFNLNGLLDKSFSHSYLEIKETAGSFVEFTAHDFIQAGDDRFLVVGNARYSANPHWETVVVAFKHNPEIIISSMVKAPLLSPFELQQNIPNPCAGNCMIPVSVQKKCDMKLELFDMHGRKVSTIYEGFVEAGEHLFSINRNTVLNGSDSSGIYFYRMTFFDKQLYYTQTKKILFIN